MQKRLIILFLQPPFALLFHALPITLKLQCLVAMPPRHDTISGYFVFESHLF